MSSIDSLSRHVEARNYCLHDDLLNVGLAAVVGHVLRSSTCALGSRCERVCLLVLNFAEIVIEVAGDNLRLDPWVEVQIEGDTADELVLGGV